MYICGNCDWLIMIIFYIHAYHILSYVFMSHMQVSYNIYIILYYIYYIIYYIYILYIYYIYIHPFLWMDAFLFVHWWSWIMSNAKACSTTIDLWEFQNCLRQRYWNVAATYDPFASEWPHGSSPFTCAGSFSDLSASSRWELSIQIGTTSANVMVVVWIPGLVH